MNFMSILLALLVLGPSYASSHPATAQIAHRSDGSEFHWFLDRREQTGSQGVVVLAQGSGCTSPAHGACAQKTAALALGHAVVVPEKAGVVPGYRPAEPERVVTEAGAWLAQSITETGLAGAGHRHGYHITLDQGDGSAYPQSYSQGATFWSEIDRILRAAGAEVGDSMTWYRNCWPRKGTTAAWLWHLPPVCVIWAVLESIMPWPVMSASDPPPNHFRHSARSGRNASGKLGEWLGIVTRMNF